MQSSNKHPGDAAVAGPRITLKNELEDANQVQLCLSFASGGWDNLRPKKTNSALLGVGGSLTIPYKELQC